MTERLEIIISGDLSEKGKHATLAAAEKASDEFVSSFNETHGTKLIGTLRAVRPGKKGPKTAAATPLRPAEE